MPHYIKVSQTASTNTYLSRLAATLPGGTVIYTPSQTAGRGQKGNSWESEDGKNLTFSMLLKRPPVKARRPVLPERGGSPGCRRGVDGRGWRRLHCQVAQRRLLA